MKRPAWQVLLVILAAAIALVCGAQGAWASETSIHDQVEHGLVKLSATGLVSVGDRISQPVTAVGTGFFIGEGGYILTTAHLFDPLKEVIAVDTRITAKVFGLQGEVDVLYISELSSLDLVLLRAFVPRGLNHPPSLEIGSSKDIDLDDPSLLTSGWDDSNYLRDKLGFNTSSTQLVPYAWTLRGNVQGGQSGSPVYIDLDGKPLVVGVLKATARNNTTLALMIPIENSFQLIGQFKAQEMQNEITRLRQIIGEMRDGEDKPLADQVGDVGKSVEELWEVVGRFTDEDESPERSLFERVDYVEDSVEEIANSFAWSAEADQETGSLVVSYEKLISGGLQLDEIQAKITPVIYKAGDGNIKEPTKEGTWAARTALAKKPLDQSGKIRTFEFSGVQEELTEQVLKLDRTFRDQEPYQHLQLSIRAEVEGGIIVKDIPVEPNFKWSYD